MNNVTEKFLEFVISFEKREFEQVVYEQAKLSVLDFLGCCYLGNSLCIRHEEWYLNSCTIGKAKVIGGNYHTSIYEAAFLNGFHAHAIELDDGHRYGMLHPGAPVISALLAAAQQFPMSGVDFLKGVIAGYEATIRLASAIQPSHKLCGFHATGTCGTIGAAVGVVVALHMSREELNSVLTCAATNSSGLLEVIDDGSELKPYNVGSAARNGLEAAMFGKLKYKGPKDVLGGKRGFLKVLSPELNLSWFEADKLSKPAIMGIYRKAYASCRHCHAPVECAIKIHSLPGFDYHKIQEIMVETYGLAVYGHDQTLVDNVAVAKMSTPFSVAVALYTGDGGYNAMTEKNINAQEIAAVTKKVRVMEREDLSALVPEKRAAIVRVLQNDGKIFQTRVDYPKGEPENPIDEDDIIKKFQMLAISAGIESERIRHIIRHIKCLELKLDDLLQEL